MHQSNLFWTCQPPQTSKQEKLNFLNQSPTFFQPDLDKQPASLSHFSANVSKRVFTSAVVPSIDRMAASSSAANPRQKKRVAMYVVSRSSQLLEKTSQSRPLCSSEFPLMSSTRQSGTFSNVPFFSPGHISATESNDSTPAWTCHQKMPNCFVYFIDIDIDFSSLGVSCWHLEANEASTRMCVRAEVRPTLRFS